MSGTPKIRSASFVKMKSSSLFLTVWCFILVEFNILQLSSTSNIRETAIRLRILEFDSESGRLVQILTSRNSDIIYGEGINIGNAIVLECRSPFGPVAFTYKGDGTPAYVTNTNTTRSSQQGLNFWSFMSFTRVPRSEDTGNYTCMSITNDQMSNSVHLYIPDYTQVIFVPTSSNNRLEFSRSDGSIRIPCSVIHPDARVSLERISDYPVQPDIEFRKEVFERVTYNPKRGFYIPLSMVNPGSSSTFLCRGTLNGRTEESTYQLFSEEPSADLIQEVTTQNSRLKKPEGLISSCTSSTCGLNAECIVIEYNPHCVCNENYAGNPKEVCYKINDHSQQLTVQDPCNPSKCGKFSQCIVVNRHPVCSCLPKYYGQPPFCTSEKSAVCTTSNDCEWEELCNQETRTCKSVCNGSVKFCGENSRCFVVNHTPFCECITGFTGNPYLIKSNTGCKSITPVQVQEKPICNPSSCGLNALCRVLPNFRQPICLCPEGYTGDATSRCFKFPTSSAPAQQPEDIQRRLCNRTSCGSSAKCRVRNNEVQCSCPTGYQGDPYYKCTSMISNVMDKFQMCNACGPNSICRVKNNEIFCECAPETTGSPPTCQLRRSNTCRDNIDCPEDRVCYRGKCVDPCPLMCSPTAICEVIHHITKCKCPQGYEGDPQFSCQKSTKTEMDLSKHPCRINCGPNTICRAVPYSEVQQYRDTLRKGKQEAIFFDMIRANGNLQSGVFSECFCRKDFDGNPYSVSGCHPKHEEDLQFPVMSTIVMEIDPCKPNNPCGRNSSCRGFNGRAFCTCNFNSTGNPPNCKLRCQADKDCLFNESCTKGLCEISL